MRACFSDSPKPLAAPRPARGSSLPRSVTTPSRGLKAVRRAHLVNAATVEKTETDLTAELKDVLSRVKPKVHARILLHPWQDTGTPYAKLDLALSAYFIKGDLPLMQDRTFMKR